MFEYIKVLEFPVNIKATDVEYAKVLNTAIGGPQGELNAALTYFMQASSISDLEGRNLLFTIATEELAHVEILYAMMNQLTAKADLSEFKKEDICGFADNGKGIFPTNAHGLPFRAEYIASTGDAIADLAADMAAEERARAGYEGLMKLTDREDILAPLSFLRQREIVHYERFKELYLKYKSNKQK